MPRGRIVAALPCLLVALVWACAAAGATANQPLRTAIYLDPDSTQGVDSSAPATFDRIVRTGATAARVTIYWSRVAPENRPDSWDPTNPADPHYRWDFFDAVVRNMTQHGLEPLVTIMAAPAWAQGIPQPLPNSHRPDPAALAAFAKAAATRYSGSFQGLPRVRWWQAWNEPNISLYLIPQLKAGEPISPGWYRSMLNAFADAVHSVSPDNVVAAGGLAPFRDITPDVLAQDNDWGPLSFMRAVLCLSKTLQPTCSDRTAFDAWATHPYTSGGPLHTAVLPNDVSLGDLPEMRKTLAAAVKAGHVVSRAPPEFWVTEFSWDSKPPDPCSPSMALLSRWIPEALYRMWSNGVDLVVWFQLQDKPLATSFLQSGFYFESGSIASARPKPTLEGFRFPFVALRRGKGVYVWARTPAGKAARLVVEQRKGSRWAKVGTFSTNGVGIVSRVLKAKPTGSFRARVFPSNEASLAFSMKVPPDQFFNPFGQPKLLEPTDKPRCLP